MKERRLSQAKLGKSIGVSASYINQVLKGTCPPLPLENVPSWARALGLVEGTPEWDEFHLQAELTHCPPGIRARLASAIAEHRDLARLARQAVAERDAARAELEQLRSDLNSTRKKP